MTQKVKDKPKNDQPSAKNNQLVLFGIIGAVTVAAVVVILLAFSGGQRVAVDYASIPQSRTDDGGFVLGAPEAPITFVVFEDFLCSHCQAYEPELSRFVADFVATGQAKLEFRMLQTSSPTPLLFQVAECTEQIEPGSFWEGREVMFDMTINRTWTMDNGPRDFAEKMGISYSDLLECQSTARQYIADAQLAQTNSVGGTPTVLVRYNDGALQAAVGESTRPSYDGLKRLTEAANALQ